MIKILKASAGSGKTYNLAKEYIKLLIQDRNLEDGRPYRHILAVTFTNKATAEMKARILKELDVLSRNPQASPYLAELLEETDLETPQQISEVCAASLAAILGDYGAFSVSTIDKFFQRVLRAFSREIGQLARYQVELNKDSLVQESVDRVLDSITSEDDALLKWLSQCSIEAIEAGDGYKLEKNLSAFASGYKSESYRHKLDNLKIDKDKAFSEENITELKAICKAEITSFEENFSTAVRFLAEIADRLEPALTANFKKIVAGLKKYKPGDKIDVWDKTTWMLALDTVEKAFLKGRLPSVTEQENLLMAIHGVQNCRQQYRRYCTAKLMRDQVSLFYVAKMLDREFDALLKEKNVLSLEDSNTMLRDIISTEDAPFVYEKVGVRYWHFLLDEFQDTSLTQWENFKPLLLGSLASNFYNLIVGDVKQSIYRWRNAEWDILDTRVESELRDVRSESLVQNWRSAPRIVEFNNHFYPYLAQTLEEQLRRKIPSDLRGKMGYLKPVPEIYSDVKQEARCKLDTPGCVEAHFCESSDIIAFTVEAVKGARQRGFSWKDVAVIVRTNKLGSDVASELIAAGIPVISNDSLLICNGLTVRRLVSCLSKIDDPKDAIGAYFAKDFEPESIGDYQSLCDLADAILRTFDKDAVNTDTLYVLAFMDLLRDYVSKNGNTLHSFLKYWKEEGVGKAISSPENSDAVTIITIHKVKGLAYPYVVIPFSPKGGFMKADAQYWECPDTEGTSLDKVEKALYRTTFGDSSKDTLFAENYYRELRLSYIDAANVLYVATTRASQSMTFIAPLPAKSHKTGVVTLISDALFDYASQYMSRLDDTQVYYCGEARMKVGESVPEGLVQKLRYIPEGAGEAKRPEIRNRGESRDFFDTPRRRGIVLHKIMESVHTPSDLPGSVERARKEGLLDAAQAAESLAMLSEAVAGVSDRGWFAEGAVFLDERDILTADGTYRPDRVVLKDGKVEIIDYKFAEKDASHHTQVQRYAQYYRQMGYSDVKAYLWYIDSGEVEEVL